MARQYYNNVGYSLNQSPLNNLAVVPVVALRAPSTQDTNYPLGTLWVYKTTNAIYALTSVTTNSANWQLMGGSGGAGVFTTLTSTGATTLATTGASTNTFGNTTGATSVGILAGSGGINLTGAVTSANAVTVTAGNVTLTNGDLILSTAATFVQLPGPIKIMSGAGAPGAGLATEAGDTYIRTDPAGATSRIYVATGAGTWTNVTCAG